MFISIPKEFFVPVLFSEEFRYNRENNSMEYDSEYEKTRYVNDRKRLQDIDCRDDDNTITEEYIESLINIDDKMIEEQISNYSKSFLKFIEDLKNANCIDKSKINLGELLDYYARSFRELYNNYRSLVRNISMPISKADEEGILDKYIGELEDIYNKNLQEINCKNLDYNEIENITNQMFEDARDILKEEIKNINCDIININDTCENVEVAKKDFDTSSKIFNNLDNEYIAESIKK
ncbi:MAG: hypothetical protein IJO26_00120 [Clostridium sp.]|nr:hypothetical protein [Clostridium sp.]